MNKTLLIAVSAIILVVVGVWLIVPRQTQAPEPVTTMPEGWTLYSKDHTTIQVPPGYTVNENYNYQGLGPGAEIPGISFTIPATLATGTNLSSDTRLSIETVEGECDAVRFVADGSVSEAIVDAGTKYSVARASGAGAGNRYEEIVYALSDSVPCRIVRYFIHSTAIENYEPGTITSFDKEALLEEFDTMRHSLTVE